MDKENFLAFYEEAGYRVVDSFTYSDIKTFLMRNRPRTKFRTIYVSVLVVVLFLVGLMVGMMWHDSSSAGQFFLEIGESVILALVGYAIIVPLHEIIHWVVYRTEGAADVRFGAIWRSFVFFAAAHNFLTDYKTFKRIALAPLRILSGLLVVLLLFPLPLWGKIAIAVLLFLHLLSCSGDLMMLAYMSRYKGREVYTVDDIDNRYTYFLEKKQ